MGGSGETAVVVLGAEVGGAGMLGQGQERYPPWAQKEQQEEQAPVSCHTEITLSLRLTCHGATLSQGLTYPETLSLGLRQT